MTVTQIWRASRVCAAGDGQTSTESGRRGRNHRAGRRLWALLNAQALLDSAAGTPGSVALAEDDRQRMAARHAN